MLCKLLDEEVLNDEAQFSKCIIGMASAEIGIKLWFVPQISEHCP